MYRTLIAVLALAAAAPAFAQQREAVVFVSTGESMVGHPSDPSLMRGPDLKPSEMLRLLADYPQPARRARHKGEVVLAVRVGADDRILDCRMTESAGSADLDTAACAIVQRRARFRHALANDGTPRETVMRVKVTFDIFVNDGSSGDAVVYVPPAMTPIPGDKSRRPEVLDPDALTIRGAASALFVEADPMVNLDIDADGRVTRCSIFMSAGTDQGDILLCRTASAARYRPALDSRGTPIAAETIEMLQAVP